MLYFILQILKEILEEHDRLNDHSTALTSVQMETLESSSCMEFSSYAAASSLVATGSKFSLYGINTPSIISGMSLSEKNSIPSRYRKE